VPFHAVYLQRRQPGVSYRDFQRLWRSHGDFAAGVPAFWDRVERYVHNDPVEDAASLPGDTARFDAIGELFYTSYENWLAIRDVMWHQIAPDEKRMFNGPSTAVRGNRTIHQPPRGTHKLFTFAKYREGMEVSALDAALTEHVAMIGASPQFGARLAGFTVTRAQAHDTRSGMDTMPQTTSNRDIVFIHHFDDEVAARAALASADYARMECAQDCFLDWGSRIVILTHGWILKGEMG
jgi:hypothetical protein